MELFKLTAHEMKDLLKKKKVSAEEIVLSQISRISQSENNIQAFITMCRKEALLRAKQIDTMRIKGEDLPELSGIPIAIKDNICTKKLRTTCASKILENFIPAYDATVVEKLNSSNTILLGKTNMDEFAMGSSTENSAFKSTTNPWNFTRVPGGSSGGSAASVSSDEVTFALGSDTGGSIRQPASFCGVVGMKPTYGTISRYGLVAFASSLDQIGPITKDVTDCALVLNAITGYDKKDSTSANRKYPDYTNALVDHVKGLKIGVPREYFGNGLHETVKKSILKALEQFVSMGAVYEEMTLPYTDYALSAYYLISSAEATSNLARYDGVKYGFRAMKYNDMIDMYKQTRSQGFGLEVKRRIMIGNYALSSGYYDAYYLKALKVRTLIKQDFDSAFEKYDIILSPTAPSTAFLRGEKSNDPMEMYLSDIYTVPVNIAGLPAISIPCGFDDSGLPIGLQMIGKPFDESILIKAAYAFEQNTDHHLKKPSMIWR